MSKEIIATETSKKLLTKMAAKAAELKREGKDEEYSEFLKSLGEIVVPIIEKMIDCESAAYKLDEETKLIYADNVYNVYERDFYKYNNVEYKKDGEEEIEYEFITFLKSRTKDCIRDAIAKNLGISQYKCRILLRIKSVRFKLAKEKSIREDQVSYDDIWERLGGDVDKATIADLINIEKGCKSLDEIRESGECVDSYTEKGFDLEEDVLDFDVKCEMDKIFENMSKLDVLILLKNYGFLGEKMYKMEVKEFVRLPIFKALFEEDTTIRSKKDPVKTVYAKTQKAEKIFIQIRENINMGDIESEGCLINYLKERLNG